MPYIKPKFRDELDPLIANLCDKLCSLSMDDPNSIAGLLNYSFTQTVLVCLKQKFDQPRYWLIALMSGVLRNTADEFYRRYAAPYEDRQAQLNGDVYIDNRYFMMND